MASRDANSDIRRPRPESISTALGTATEVLRDEESSSLITPLSPQHEASKWAQGAFGNAILVDALAGQTDVGPGQVAMSEISLGAAGVGGSSAELGSNQAMLRVMRNAMALDPKGQRALEHIGNGGGSMLPTEHLERMERAFDQDFSHVRIHADGRAAEAAESLQAYAFALGAHIYFGAGQFAPGSRSGDRLLAHELTHVVQSDQGRLPAAKSGGGVDVSSPSDPHEREAYANEVHMLDVLVQVDREIAAERSGDISSADSLAVENASSSTVQSEAPATQIASPIADFGTESVTSDSLSFESGVESSEFAEVSVEAPASELTASAETTAMRDRAHDSLDTSAATSFIRNSRGAALPAAVAQRLGAALGHDFAHVKVHTDDKAAKAAEALGAHAFALGTDVFFGAGEFAPGTRAGDHLLAHELTHVVQHDEGRLPSSGSDDLSVSSPMDSAEREAEAVAAQVAPALSSEPLAESAAFAPVTEVSSSLDAASTAMRTSTPDGGAPAAGGGSGAAPEKVKLRIAGIEVEVRVPANPADKARVIVRLDWTPIPGITVRDAVLTYNENWELQSGTANATITVGDVISVDNAALTIDKEGNVKVQVRGVDFSIDDGFVTGTIDLDLSPEGLTGQTTVGFDKIRLDDGVTLENGSVTLRIKPDGHVEASGQLTGAVAGLGRVTIAAQLTDKKLGGQVTVEFENNLQLAPGVRLARGRVAGAYDRDAGSTVRGDATININDVAEASVSVTYVHPAKAAGDSAATAPGAAPAVGGPTADAGPAAGPAAGPQAQTAPNAAPASGPASAPASTGPASGPAAAGPQAAGPAAQTDAPATAPGVTGPQRASRTPGAGQQGGQTPSNAVMFSLPGGGKISGTGTLRQLTDLSMGDLTVSASQLTVNFKDNVLTQVGASADYTFDKFAGHVNGTYDVASQQVSGTGTCRLTEELAVGDSGVIIKAADGEITVVNNVPTTLKGNITVSVPYEDQPTFTVVGSGLIWDFAAQEFSGGVTATTDRELTFGDVAGMHILVASGASAQGAVDKNKLTQINGALAFTVVEPAGEVGAGTATLEFTPENSVNAKAEFHLTTDYGVPDRAEGLVWFKEGGSISVDVVAGELSTAKIKNVEFDAALPSATEGSIGIVHGNFEGDIDFKTHLVQGKGHGEIQEPVGVSGKWGHLSFKAGGSIDGEVKDSVLTELKGNFPYDAEIIGGGKTYKLEGELKGAYDPAGKTFGGELNGKLMDNVEFMLPEGKGKLILKKDSTAKIAVEESNFPTVGFNLNVDYCKAGEDEPLFSGSIADATYNILEDKLSFIGEVELKKDITKASENGKWTYKGLAGSKVNITVSNNNLTKIGGELKFGIDDPSTPFLEGSLKNLDMDIEKQEFSGDVDVATARDFDFPRLKDGGATGDISAAGYHIVVVKGSHFGGKIEKNELSQADAELNYHIDFLSVKEAIVGNVAGKYDFKEDKFTGGAKLNVMKPFPLPVGGVRREGGKVIESLLFGVVPGSTIDIDVKDNELQRAHTDLTVVMEYNDDDVASANLTGDYKLGDEQGFSGKASANVNKRFELAAKGANRFSYHVDAGTTFNADIAQTQITSAVGTFIVVAQEEEGKDSVKASVGGSWAPATGVSGDATADIVSDIEIGTSAKYKVKLEKGSTATANVTNDALTHIGGTVKIRLDEGDKHKARAELNVNYDVSQGKDAKINGTGEITVLDDIEVQSAGQFKFILEKDTHATGTITDNDLASMTGDFKVRVQYQGADLARGNLNGTYLGGTAAEFSGRGSVEIIRPRLDLGMPVSAGGSNYAFFLMAGAGVEAVFDKNELQTLSAAVPIQVTQNTQPFVGVKLDGTYDHKAKTIAGRGEGTLLKRVTVAQNVAGYSYFIEAGGAAWAEMSNTAGVEKVGGNLTVTVDDGRPFAVITAEVDATLGDAPKINATGSATILHDKLLLGGPASAWKVTLEAGPLGTFAVKDSQLDQLSGQMKVRVDDDKQFARVELDGTWRKDAGFSGRGKASLLRDIKMAGGGGYEFWLKKESGGEVELAANEVTKVGGKVRILIKDPADFMEGEVTGDYLVKEKMFSGSGSISVISERQLGQANGQKLVLIPGSGVNVNVTNNDLDRVGGNLTVSLRDATEYLKCSLNGSYDIKGGTGFTGDGAVTVTRKKELAKIGAYSFSLDNGTGAHAEINKNELVKVDGQVPFIVGDAKGDLLKGHAGGLYDHKTGKFSGTGDVRLARDVEFQLGGDSKVVFKAGSGGNGEVKDNELRKLGGTLTAELWNKDGALVRVSAAGEYDAVENKIKRLEGSATLLQPLKLLGGALIVSNVAGNAKIVDNKLVSAGGKGQIEIPSLNNMKGQFDVKWSNETGRDVYEGSGKLDFVLIRPDPAKGRSMSGSVDASYSSDDHFSVHGKARYNITKEIGGDIDVALEGAPGQALDPVIGASFTATGQLIQAKDLFRKKMDILKGGMNFMAGPVPITLGYGVLASMGLSMEALRYTATVGFQGWHPLAQSVPTFDAELGLTWGLNFDAMLAAYLQLGIGCTACSAGAGIRGEAIANVRVGVNPKGRLKGSAAGFSGELEIGASASASMQLRAVPFLYAEFLGARAQADMPNPPTLNLPDIFKFEWGKKYTFGDTTSSTAAPAGSPTQAPATQRPTEHKSEPSVGQAKAPTASQAPGGPAIGANDAQSPDAGAAGGQMGELMDKINKIKTVAEGIGAVGYLADLISGLLTALAFGPVALLLYVVWKVVTGELSWDRIKKAVQDVVKAVQVGAEMLRPMLPSWLQKIIDIFSGEKPGLLDAFFGADDKMRDEVRKGTHRQAPPELRGRMVKEMWSGYCSDDDAWCITQMLREVPVRDCLLEVGPNDLLGSFSSSPFNAAKPLIERAGYRVTTSSAWF